MLGMANLRPEDTGVPAVLHVLKDIEHRTRHAPRIKAFPGRPHEGRATIIAIPTRSDARAEIIGKATIRGPRLRAILDFVERNWRSLLLYWYEPEYDKEDLMADLRLERGS
jgi:hypothetical protein